PGKPDVADAPVPEHPPDGAQQCGETAHAAQHRSLGCGVEERVGRFEPRGTSSEMTAPHGGARIPKEEQWVYRARTSSRATRPRSRLTCSAADSPRGSVVHVTAGAVT